MKNSFLQIVLAVCLLFSFGIHLSAQKTNVWKGGAAGHASEWSYFKNWSAGHVPSEFDRVIIPDVSTSTDQYPLILTGEVEVLSLEIQSGASLTVLPQARLLTTEIEILGTCKGCEQRLLPEGRMEVVAFSAENHK